MSCKCCGTMKWIGGFLTGAAVGAAAALLLAPESGKETREKITEGVRGTYYDAYDAVLNFGDKISDQIADLRADFREWTEKIKKEKEAAFEDAFDADDYEDVEEADFDEASEITETENANEAAEEQVQPEQEAAEGSAEE